MSRHIHWAAMLCALLGCAGVPEPVAEDTAPVAVCDDAEATALFEQRIAPILADDHPASCGGCHLAGVDLSVFVRGDACASMACLEDQDLVDLDNPEQSLLLSWIGRATPGSDAITADTIDAEYEGVLEWIRYTAACPGACGDAVCDTPELGDECPLVATPNVVPRSPAPGDSCEPKALEEIYTETIHTWRGRCYPCHFTNTPPADDGAPRWLVAEGPCELGGLETMRNVLAAGYVDLADPSQSLILLKPLAEEEGGVFHAGTTKFDTAADTLYMALLFWIERVAACDG